MAIQDSSELTGLEKAAVLLIALGTEAAAQVFRHLDEAEIERLSGQIISMRNVAPEIVAAVMAEFEEMRENSTGVRTVGKDFAAQVLEQVVGKDKAVELMDHAAESVGGRPFESLWDMNPAQLSRVLTGEHPQVIALVLAHLPPDRSAAVLSECSTDVQADVSHRICTLGQIDTDVINAVEEALRVRLSSGSSRAVSSGGPKILVEILNHATRPTERNVLDSLAAQDPEIGEKVRRMMFVFEDLPKLEDRTVQVVLREVDQEDLRMALKGSDDTIKELVFKNMSERAAEMLKEDLELLSKPRAVDVEAAQQKIVGVVRRLLASGEAMLRSEDEESGDQGQSEHQPGEEQVVEQSDQEKLAA